mmetsp:Transcript_22138/g.61526  ORF Transcript_22138/g.61526 Transcript_22138/m.61526 type:complete len:80 (+) Transcript_22138:822-1061(+)
MNLLDFVDRSWLVIEQNISLTDATRAFNKHTTDHTRNSSFQEASLEKWEMPDAFATGVEDTSTPMVHSQSYSVVLGRFD